jgi:putative transposase
LRIQNNAEDGNSGAAELPASRRATGHNKQVVFAQEADYRYYLSTLEGFKGRYGVKVYGFCLMTNHVHLILEPGAKTDGLGQLMKRLSGRQTRFVNRQAS